MSIYFQQYPINIIVFAFEVAPDVTFTSIIHRQTIFSQMVEINGASLPCMLFVPQFDRYPRYAYVIYLRYYPSYWQILYFEVLEADFLKLLRHMSVI